MKHVAGGAGDDSRRHLGHVARGGALNLAGAGVSAVAGFLLVVVVTHRYDSEVAGHFFTLTSVFLLLLAVATLGSETGLGRFLLRYEALGRHGDIPPTIRAALRPTMLYSVIIAVVVIAFADPLADLIGLGGGESAASLRVLALTLPLATWNALTLAGTRAFGRMRATVAVDKIGRPVLQLVAVLAVSFSAAELVGMTLAWAVPYALAALASAWMFQRFLQRRGTYQHDQPTRTYRELSREFWRFTWPRSITRISQMAIQRMDIVLIAALRGPKDAAIYTAATRFVALGQFGTQATQQVLQPKFTALIANDDHHSLAFVYRVATAWNMAVAWPMYVGVAAAPLVYLSIFGEGYSQDESVSVVLLMALSMLFAVATGPADTLLLMSGRSTLSLINSLVALAVDIGLCLLLIPNMGIVGAALAWAISVTARCTLSVIQVRWTMSIISFGPAAFVVAVANVLAFGVPLLVIGAFVDLSLLQLALIVVALLPVYAGLLWLGRRHLVLEVLRELLRGRRAGNRASTADESPGDEVVTTGYLDDA